MFERLPNCGPKQSHTFSGGVIFPHLHRPSCKVYSLIPGPLCYKRAEDPGLFSLQSLSFLIRETQTLEDNSRPGGVKERWRDMLIIEGMNEKRKEGTRGRIGERGRGKRKCWTEEAKRLDETLEIGKLRKTYMVVL